MFALDDLSIKTAGHTRQHGYIQNWKLGPNNRPAGDLVRLAELLSLHHLDPSGELGPLDREALVNAAWQLNPQPKL